VTIIEIYNVKAAAVREAPAAGSACASMLCKGFATSPLGVFASLVPPPPGRCRSPHLDRRSGPAPGAARAARATRGEAGRRAGAVHLRAHGHPLFLRQRHAHRGGHRPRAPPPPRPPRPRAPAPAPSRVAARLTTVKRYSVKIYNSSILVFGGSAR
jgi:hypothetical protein